MPPHFLQQWLRYGATALGILLLLAAFAWINIHVTPLDYADEPAQRASSRP